MALNLHQLLVGAASSREKKLLDIAIYIAIIASSRLEAAPTTYDG
jgi:hypothetical protein